MIRSRLVVTKQTPLAARGMVVAEHWRHVFTTYSSPGLSREKIAYYVDTGLSTALWGAFKKVVIADSLGSHVAPLFHHPDPSGPMIWAEKT